ncbi:META domain-containing protein [Flavihumibacter sp. RY-1]|uniref:META domain-containing protein n=1 Tax=Flavihumibacter fluminis TaxID=2909236 RepID=A0ABS9BIP3_9BACT|nr:META domain-containing protein [Flavihumibacter fluminis]MCF1715602.1 META domain-containing protein [Flavihumibacter fluminis]
MGKLLRVLFVFIVLAGCNNASDKSVSSSVALVDSIQSSTNHYCYENAAGTDSIRLSIDLVGTDVSGELLYAIRGKDRNEGSVHGEWFGDTLVLDYMYQSEGSLSSRQVVFIKQDSILVEGYGASEEVDGKIRFVNRAELSFGQGIRLKEVNCETPLAASSPVASTAPIQLEQGSEVLYMYRWELKELNGTTIEEARRGQFFLLFTPGQVGRVSGKGGCNRISGNVELLENRGLKFGAIASTKMACPDMEQEAIFLKSLAEVNQWKIVNNVLYLQKDGSNLALFQSVTNK